jgi:hypothetical protein
MSTSSLSKGKTGEPESTAWEENGKRSELCPSRFETTITDFYLPPDSK